MCDLVVRLPRDCMNKLVCCECNGYLRVGPIKTTLDGNSVCGKCSDNPKYASAICTKAFNDVLSVISFPCIYEKYGCQECFVYNDLSNHEERCEFRCYRCPADSVICNWFGTALQIPQHYKENHSDLCMNLPVFEIHANESFERTRLYMPQEFAFLVKSKMSRQDGKLWVNLEYIGGKDIADEITYKLVFLDGDWDGFQTILKARTCNQLSKRTLFDLDNFHKIDVESLINILQEPDSIFCTLNIYIPKVTTEKVYKQLRRIRCASCSVFMSIPIYQCPDGHNMCADCMSYTSKCILCKKEGLLFGRNSELELISASYLLRCRWRNCGRTFSESELRKHEQKCNFKSYKCPHHCKYRGDKEEIIEHLSEDHDPLHLVEVTIESDRDHYNFSMFVHEEIFQCSFRRKPEDTIEFTARYSGLSTFCDNYIYLVEVKSEEQSKSYQLSKSEALGDSFIFKLVLCRDDLHVKGSYYFIFKIDTSTCAQFPLVL